MGRLGDSIKRLTASLGLSRSEDGEKTHADVPDLARLQESDSDSELDASYPEAAQDSAEAPRASAEGSGQSSKQQGSDKGSEQDSEQDSEDDDSAAEQDSDAEDVPLEDAELDDDADVVPFQKVTINNRPALQHSLEAIRLPAAARNNFVEHVTVAATEPMILKDVYDDTERELAFYKQALAAVDVARRQLRTANVPFSRPTDYFAEMVKSDEHMQKVHQKLVDEETSKRASQEARKQRELKKFGKKVQHERLEQRQAEKRKTLERIASLKKKRRGQSLDSDQFDVGIEDALTDKSEQRDARFKLGNQAKDNGGRVRKGPNHKRMAKNAKYGSGQKRGSKRNTAESSMDVSGFSKRRKH